jgi:trk system potassium uptake protein TrkH
MRNGARYFRPILDYLGLLSWVFGLLMLVPLGYELVCCNPAEDPLRTAGFGIPAVLAVVLGAALKRNLRFPPLDERRAMLLIALGWIVVSAIGSLPLWLGLRISFLDAYFESVSGFTTTGITMLEGLDWLPTSILFWRSFIQWLGGLGILAFFLAVLYTGGSANRLFSAESHKVFSKRPAPGLFHTLRILWLIYAGLTALVAAALVLEGTTVFEAITHAMTALSTGGYSPFDASVGYFAEAGYRNAVLIEYTIIFGMLAGGINFLVHSRVLRGSVEALWTGMEMRLFWSIVVVATAIVMFDHMRVAVGHGTAAIGDGGIQSVHDVFRASLFQVVSILTTTGFATRDIGSQYFPAASKQIFLILMVMGGCVGSTGGGVKVLRVGIMFRMIQRQLRRAVRGPASVQLVVVDGEPVEPEELRRVSALFFAWVALLVFGGLVTALLSEYDALASASGMFSALGNIGPCYISGPDMVALHPVVKIVYTLGMLAGRLEIIPLLLLFTPRSWR